MGANKMKKTLCPVCAKYIFVELTDEEKENGEKPEDDFCNFCGWRYDASQLKNFDLKTNINKFSINELKKLYENKIDVNPNYYYLDEIKSKPVPHLCPVCGKYEFYDWNSYDICSYCGWEDDSFDQEEFKNEISAVGFTFAEYKKIYEAKIKKNPNYRWNKEQQ